MQDGNQYNFLFIIMHMIISAISTVNNHLDTWFLTDIQRVCTRDHKKEHNFFYDNL